MLQAYGRDDVTYGVTLNFGRPDSDAPWDAQRPRLGFDPALAELNGPTLRAKGPAAVVRNLRESLARHEPKPDLCQHYEETKNQCYHWCGTWSFHAELSQFRHQLKEGAEPTERLTGQLKLTVMVEGTHGFVNWLFLSHTHLDRPVRRNVEPEIYQEKITSAPSAPVITVRGRC